MTNFSLFTAVKVLSHKRSHDFFHREPLWSSRGSTSAPPKFPSTPVPPFVTQGSKVIHQTAAYRATFCSFSRPRKGGKEERSREMDKALRWDGGGHSLSTSHLCNCHGAACTPMLRSVASGRDWLEWGRTLSLVLLRLRWNNVTSDPVSWIIWNISLFQSQTIHSIGFKLQKNEVQRSSEEINWKSQTLDLALWYEINIVWKLSSLF